MGGGRIFEVKPVFGDAATEYVLRPQQLAYGAVAPPPLMCTWGGGQLWVPTPAGQRSRSVAIGGFRLAPLMSHICYKCLYDISASSH